MELLHCDCIDYMANCSDKEFDLAIVDPPYGINAEIVSGNVSYDKKNGGNRRRLQWDKKWDEKPNRNYFDELFRISKEQIIWGGNYFLEYLTSTRCFLMWDKIQSNFDGADFELAWTSFDKSAKAFRMSRMMAYAGGDWRSKKGTKIHPTQKPVELYNWIFENYAMPEWKVIDTHLGSGSSAIAAHYFGCDFVGCEIDKEYYDKMMKRFKNETSQTILHF